MKWLHFLACLPFILISVKKLQQIIHKHQVELVHTNSQVVIDGALAAKIARIPHIWHARELLIPETVFNFCLGPQAALGVIRYLSDKIIAMSSGVKQTFCQTGDCTKVVVIYDGFEIIKSESVNTRNSIRTELDIPKDAPLVGLIGRVTATKGVEDFVKAAAIVRKINSKAQFIVVGGRSNSDATYEKNIFKLINESHLHGIFHLVGYRDDVATIVSELDMLVLPSHTEGFGRVVVEAMLAGKPVVGTNVGGIPEIIDEGLTGFIVPPFSPEPLAQAIIKILQDSELAKRMGFEGFNKAQVNFSIARSINETQQIYQQLFSQKKRQNVSYYPDSLL
jgi:glycosyltransferase involved in cell wall biosynthesis